MSAYPPVRNLSPREVAALLAAARGAGEPAAAAPDLPTGRPADGPGKDTAGPAADADAGASHGPLLLDVREPWEYRICRIEGSRLVPMGQIPASVAELDPHRETVVVCHHGIRSGQVARWLARQGFTRLVNLQGGIDAWARDVDPSIGTY